jgi:hypothetical protein
MWLPVRAIVQVATAAGDAPARAAEILRDGGYQRELPPPLVPPDLGLLELGALGTVLRVLLWVALAVLAVLVATWIGRRLGVGARDVEVAPDAVAGGAAELPVENAEALAAEGRFAEAIHVLLLDTLATLARAGRLPPSLTSREIVGRVPLAPGAREALRALVEAVEVIWFGGAVPAEGDYRRCLERFHAFRDAYRGAA